MKYAIPADAALDDRILSNPDLLPRASDGAPSITDVQHAALTQGVARGVSLLIAAPTSTGKTLIGVWALFSWLLGKPGRTAVYLVTHKALARQKFAELTNLLRDACFGGDGACLVLANGDTIENADGNIPEHPLSAPVLVATYEKYLAMLSGAGVSEDMSSCAVICDEIQIVGDETRGKNIEILLTLLRQARWGQVVGLSAVLEQRDAVTLSRWLDIPLIRIGGREKHLRYECRTPTAVLSHQTDWDSDRVERRPPRPSERHDTEGLIAEVMADQANHPVVVFCTTKDRVYEGARSYARSLGVMAAPGQVLVPDLLEATEAARELSCYAAHGVTFHNADLLEEERLFVEGQIQSGAARIVFATTTLAAGVNFPFKTAIFDNWKRWDGKARIQRPLPTSEFQNMAGRVGRMGFDHEYGRVLFSSTDGYGDRVSQDYLSPDKISPLATHLDPRNFVQVALQLIAARICSTETALTAFLLETLSAQRAAEENVAGLDHWREHAGRAVNQLRDWGYVL
jgi:helicase